MGEVLKWMAVDNDVNWIIVLADAWRKPD